MYKISRHRQLKRGQCSSLVVGQGDNKSSTYKLYTLQNGIEGLEPEQILWKGFGSE
jgi:hypothetical protein